MAFEWENRFSEEDLREGYLLFKGGAVRSKTKRGKVYTVRVRDFFDAVVTIDVSTGQHDCKCSCWEYRTTKRCEHIVVGLYAIDMIPEQITFSGEKRVMPFKQKKINDDSDYHYYDMCKIASNVKLIEHNNQKAIRMIAEKRVKEQGMSTFQYQDGKNRVYTGILYQVEISEQDIPQKQYAEIQVGRDFLWRGRCNVRRCYCSYNFSIAQEADNMPLCQHLTAALYLLNDYLERENPGDVTDYKAKQFLSRFRRQKNASSEKMANVFLEPELQNNDGELKAAFRIGIDKPYKVKNLTDLVRVVENNETLNLGKNNAINFSLNDFDEKSVPWFEFIRGRVKENLQRTERMEARRAWGYADRYVSEKITDAILLEATAIDDFYQLCGEDMEIPYVHKQYGHKSVRGKVRCAQGMPKVQVKLRELKDENQIAGITMSGSLPSLSVGTKGVYCVNNDLLYKSTQEEYEQLQPLLDMADRYGDFSVNVGRRYLADFYHTVYPMLENIAKINDEATAKVEKYIPPLPEAVFYLDSVNNVLSCQAYVNYGEHRHSPMESKTCKSFGQVYRDYAREQEISRVVDTFFPEYDEEKKEALCTDAQDCYRVYREGVDELLKLGEIKCTDSFQNRRVRKSVGIKVGVSVESDLLNLDITSEDISREELVEVLESYRLKKKYHVLRNGDFLDLDNSELDILKQIFSDCEVDLQTLLGDKIELPMYRALYLDKLLEENEELYSHRDRHFKKLIKEFGTVKNSDLEVPASLEKIMRSYQVFGHKWIRTVMQNNFGGILADEMGLGKTLQMISVLLAEKGAEHKPALVVCPASLVYNWKEEFTRFAPELLVETVAGGVKERHKQIENYENVDVLITSYDLLKRDITKYENLTFEYQILDEAQYIKNQRTVAAKTVKVVHARHKFALTGTPIENRLSELWSIFDFLMPGFLHDYETFKEELEIPIARDKDAQCAQRLKKMIAPFVLRRLKKDVLKDLPDKIEEIRYGVMEEAQRKLYDSQILRITKQVGAESEEEFKKNKLKILAEITRTRQLCCDPSLVVEGYQGGSAKREACIDLVQSAIEGEHRILIFSQFTSMLRLLAEDLDKNNISYYTLTGETPKEERVRLMKEFNEGDVPVFLISLKAGGTGLNLTGADVVIHYDPWWNLAVQNQATDRAHRIGQKSDVTVYKLIIKGSIEEKIVKLQESTKDLADEVLNGENGTLSSLSREELLNLLT